MRTNIHGQIKEKKKVLDIRDNEMRSINLDQIKRKLGLHGFSVHKMDYTTQ